MDPLHIPSPNDQHLSHLVQGYHPIVSAADMHNSQMMHISHPILQTTQGHIMYQPTMPDSIPGPSQITQDIRSQQMENQNQIMSHHQSHVTNVPQLPIQSNAVTNPDDPNHVPFPNLLIPPALFSQHMLAENLQPNYQGQYTEFVALKNECLKNDSSTNIVTKAEPTEMLVTLDIESFDENEQNKPEKEIKEEKLAKVKKKTKRRRNAPNPAEWACNQRKLKHQRGEAYINRRGKYVPEKKIKAKKNCIESCKYKCNARIPDEDRQTIFKQFYSLNVNEKKHFLLSTTERNSVRNNKNTNRLYAYKYFFIVRSLKIVVCKNFYLGTLAISQKPIYNVHNHKSDINLPKPDGRGKSEASCHAFPEDIKSRVRKHIMSLKTIDSKPIVQFSRKKQYLENKMSIKQMYLMYCDECVEENIVPVKESMYRKLFKTEFNLHFKKQLCCKCKGSLKSK